MKTNRKIEIMCKLGLCKFYIIDRQCRAAFFTPQHKTKGLLDLIHTDV